MQNCIYIILQRAPQGKGRSPLSPHPETKTLINLTLCGCSSVDRALPCQGRGQEFESPHPHHTDKTDDAS